MQIEGQARIVQAPQTSQGQRYLTGNNKDASEKFQTLLRGSNTTPTVSSPQIGLSSMGSSMPRSIPAQFRNQPMASLASLPTGTNASTAKTMPANGSTTSAAPSGATASTTGASSDGASTHMSADQANGIWYGGSDGGASVGGIYSEKASTGGNPGLGHYNYATVSTGEDMVVSVNGLHGQNPQPTQVMALDADAILKANGNVWPSTPQELQNVLKNNPQCIVANVQATPPQMTRITGIPKGTRVVVLTGAEAIMGEPPRRPPNSMAMVTNISQLSPAAQSLVPKEALMAGGTEAMMKAQSEMMARQQASAMAEKMARDTAQRLGTQAAAKIGGEGNLQAAARQAQSRTLGSSMSTSEQLSRVRGGPPVPFKGTQRGAPNGQKPTSEILTTMPIAESRS